MLYLTIQELVAAISYWRGQSLAKGDELRLCAEAAALSKSYALMIVQGSQRIPLDVLEENARTAIQQYLKSTQNL
ncbi:DUF3717 domain-containing protein [Polynucleobacter necessarius]|uniref:DUF3717 domain-containing protein n=1 Tax=Polynucleobacter necessarius TaxID=576610 RepID=UPI000E0913C5|nr:DUF3717 domain-containing protein [Polynucleobacter necessarius]